MSRARPLLSITELRKRALAMGKDRGNLDGDCTEVRFTPTPYAEGVRNELGANWTVMALNCPAECAAFWTSILEEIARTYDIRFDG
jgi:hypothetical protein